MFAFFTTLFQYNYECNQKLIPLIYPRQEVLSDGGSKWMSHIINAHEIWNERILPSGIRTKVWEEHDPNLLLEKDKFNFQQSIKIVENRDLQELLTYTNTQGETHTNSIQDILFHIINHSTYHRGQIAIKCREHDLDPLVTDYIFYKR